MHSNSKVRVRNAQPAVRWQHAHGAVQEHRPRFGLRAAPLTRCGAGSLSQRAPSALEARTGRAARVRVPVGRAARVRVPVGAALGCAERRHLQLHPRRAATKANRHSRAFPRGSACATVRTCVGNCARVRVQLCACACATVRQVLSNRHVIERALQLGIPIERVGDAEACDAINE